MRVAARARVLTLPPPSPRRHRIDKSLAPIDGMPCGHPNCVTGKGPCPGCGRVGAKGRSHPPPEPQSPSRPTPSPASTPSPPLSPLPLLGEETGGTALENAAEAIRLLRMVDKGKTDWHDPRYLDGADRCFLVDEFERLGAAGVESYTVTGKRLFQLRDIKDQLVDKGLL